MPLLQILRSSPRNKSAVKPVEVAPKYVNEVKPIGRIAVLQKPMLAVDKIVNTVVVETTQRDYRLIITAMLTKFPHYTYVSKVKHGPKIRYWFKDTQSNITKVFSYKDMETLLIGNLTREVDIKSKGFEPEYAPKDDFIPSYCIVPDLDLDELKKVKYTIYMIKKYGSTKPFNTGFGRLFHEKFDYTDKGMSA